MEVLRVFVLGDKTPTHFVLCPLRVADRTTATTGLKGCIRLLDVNNQMYDLREKGSDVLYGSGVGECGNDPCHPNPCHHGGICHVKEAEMFHCECLYTYTGTGRGLRTERCWGFSSRCLALRDPRASGARVMGGVGREAVWVRGRSVGRSRMQ